MNLESLINEMNKEMIVERNEAGSLKKFIKNKFKRYPEDSTTRGFQLASSINNVVKELHSEGFLSDAGFDEYNAVINKK